MEVASVKSGVGVAVGGSGVGVAVGGTGVGVAVAGTAVGAAVGGTGVRVAVGSAGAPPHPASNSTTSVKPNVFSNSLSLLTCLLLSSHKVTGPNTDRLNGYGPPNACGSAAPTRLPWRIPPGSPSTRQARCSRKLEQGQLDMFLAHQLLRRVGMAAGVELTASYIAAVSRLLGVQSSSMDTSSIP